MRALRIALRLFGALLLLCIVAVVAAVLLLPRLLASDEAAERIRAAARDATGSELRWSGLDVALFPPALELRDVAAREVGNDSE